MNTILLSAAMFSDHISSAIISFIRTVLLKELIEAKTNESFIRSEKKYWLPRKNDAIWTQTVEILHANGKSAFLFWILAHIFGLLISKHAIFSLDQFAHWFFLRRDQLSLIWNKCQIYEMIIRFLSPNKWLPSNKSMNIIEYRVIKVKLLAFNTNKSMAHSYWEQMEHFN